MQGLTQVLGKSKLLLPAFKVGRFTDLVAVFEITSLCTCREVLEKWPRDFCWSYAIYRTDLPFFFFWQPQLDGTNDFSHSNDSRIIWLKILIIEHYKIFETKAFFHSFSVSFIRWFCREKFPTILFKSI